MSICSFLRYALRERPVAPSRKPVPANAAQEYYLDVYLWPVELDAEFHATAFKSPRKAGEGIAWALRGTNETFFRMDWWPKPARVEGFYETRSILDACTSQAQEELILHEAWGHALNGWSHEEGSPVMDGAGDGERVKLGQRLTEAELKAAKDDLVDRAPAMRIMFWKEGMTYRDMVGDDPH